MAKTLTVKSVLNGSNKYRLTLDGVNQNWHIIEDADTIDGSGTAYIILRGHNGQETITLATDTVIIDTTATGGTSTTYGPGSNLDAVYDALNPLFIKAKSGSGGSGGTGSVTQFAATKSAANSLTRVAGSFVRVAADETNNGDKTMYLDNGSTLEYQYTIA